MGSVRVRNRILPDVVFKLGSTSFLGIVSVSYLTDIKEENTAVMKQRETCSSVWRLSAHIKKKITQMSLKTKSEHFKIN